MPAKRVDFKYVREQASFEAVAAHYNVALEGRGDQKTALCCFHEEDTPSLKINVAKKIFNCFACGAHGNILDFVVLMEGGNPLNIDDLRPGAFKLADICRIELSRGRFSGGAATRTMHKSSGKAAFRPRPSTLERTEQRQSEEPRINKPLSFVLKLDSAHPYLEERGLSKAIIETFGLGVADRGLMENRLAIPIHNEKGELIGYAGRWVGNELPKGTPKYRLPDGFSKQSVLFNLHRLTLTSDARARTRIVLVESYFSVFKLHEWGIPVVSPMGHSVSQWQCELLAAIGVDEIVILFDGDEAGAQGLRESLPILAPYFFVHAPAVPTGFKPHRATAEQVADLLS